MKCPNCNSTESKVLETRTNDDDFCIRRRRECTGCQKRFTTYETIETAPVYVIKRDKSRQPFDENKLRAGIVKACEKRPVSMLKINALVQDIKRQINNSLVEEVSSLQLGEMVATALRDIDEVAYIRFASVYRQFKDMTTFKAEIEKLLSDKK